MPLPDYPDRWETRTIVVNRYVSYENFDVMTLGGLYSSRYIGAVVDSVEVNFGSQDHQVGVSLITNGVTADSVNSVWNYVSLRPRYAAQLGRDLHSMNVEVSGYVFVSSIQVNIRRDGNYVPWSDQSNEMVLRSSDTVIIDDTSYLDLSTLIDPELYYGFRVVSVQVTGRSLRNDYSMLQFFINGTEADRSSVGSDLQARMFYAQGTDRVGTDISSLQLLSDGDFEVQGIEIRIAK